MGKDIRPRAGEYAPHFEPYVSLIDEAAVLTVLQAQVAAVRDGLTGLGAGQAASRYAEGKWAVAQVIGHIIDAERVFGYRALSVSRGETTSLPPFDEDRFAAAAGHAAIPIGELVEEFAALRQSHLLMFSHLDDAAWRRVGRVNEHPTSTVALAYIMAGHVRHHACILTGRYGVAVHA